MNNYNDNYGYNEPYRDQHSEAMICENEPMSFWDILNLPLASVTAELARKGARAIKNAHQNTRETFRTLADEEYRRMCRSSLSMDECVSWLKLQRPYYPTVGYFFIYVESNPAPRNENDLYSVTLALVDQFKKPLYASMNPMTPKSQDLVCMVFPTRTIDQKLITALNGNPSVLIKL